jgi:hypothetical protein
METERVRAAPVSRIVLAAIALALGAIVVTLEAYLVGYLDYILSTLALADEWLPVLIRVLLISAPFLLLAKKGVAAMMPWIVGVALTVLVWGYVVFKHLSGAFDEGTSVGNSMWVALVALGSTAIITIICALITRTTRMGVE